MLKYAKGKYAKNRKYANIFFNRKVREVLAKYSKRFYEMGPVELLLSCFHLLKEFSRSLRVLSVLCD